MKNKTKDSEDKIEENLRKFYTETVRDLPDVRGFDTEDMIPVDPKLFEFISIAIASKMWAVLETILKYPGHKEYDFEKEYIKELEVAMAKLSEKIIDDAITMFTDEIKNQINN